MKYQEVHRRLNESSGICGHYGGSHAVYYGLAEATQHSNMNRHNQPNEWKIQEVVDHFSDSRTRSVWEEISTLDPLGMQANIPTIAATTAIMEIPELIGRLKPDAKFVNNNQTVNITKLALDPVWNISALAEQLEITEAELRNSIFKWTSNKDILDSDKKIYLPPIGSTSVYYVGNLKAIHDPDLPLYLRPHDECNGSDVFGTDICSCRPYLVYAIEQAVKTAQRGGCGMIFYYRKEGRALGEVVKYRVYNQRKHQEGGDRAETYFSMTKDIAGVEDARVQMLMPDPLKLFGIHEVDSLLSMSKDKWEALTLSGIKIHKRQSLPEGWLPEGAQVEITAKIAYGYQNFQEDEDEAQLACIKKRCGEIRARPKHYTVNAEKVESLAKDLATRIKKVQKPWMGHGRLGHLPDALKKKVVAKGPKTLMDYVFVSCLVDAGSAQWKYTFEGKTYERSEGLAVAAYDLVMNGVVANIYNQEIVVNAASLEALDYSAFCKSLQITDKNVLPGSQNRYELLKKLGKKLDYGTRVLRPGDLIDVLYRDAEQCGEKVEAVDAKKIYKLLKSMWPADDDVWDYGDARIPFWKLLQWTTYSVIDTLEQLGHTVVKQDELTALAEYRNGGLLLEYGAITLKDDPTWAKTYTYASEEVIEWRALTVALCDELLVKVRAYGLEELTMSQMLQNGTWIFGREMAFKRDPLGNPPLKIQDEKKSGTLF